eukprot:TRINITY_DN3045_c0_g1_i1.p1 TRINITY_DN3045_c0_g1~~TRINITY_DN3045_c0_g1_i1.p1  ORF type:complete len:157 (-),score=62.43 TRINITY_DN3045_c0_g1_i1:22-456(-)
MAAAASTIVAEAKKWQTIYPAYINSQKTVQEGRRVPKSKCFENPTITQIAEACRTLGLSVVIEGNKIYPKDTLEYGRVKVQLKKDGVPVLPAIPSKRRLMLVLAEEIQKQPPVSSSSSSSSSSGFSSPSPQPASIKSKKGRKNK